MCLQILNETGRISSPEEMIETYSRLAKDSVLTKTPFEFVEAAAKYEGKPYSEVDCAGLIAKALVTYTSETGMTSMYKEDHVIGGELRFVEQLKALKVGTIVCQVENLDLLNSEDVHIVHGGIIVMHEFVEGRQEKAIYQSMGPKLGGPTYTRIDNELNDWNAWFWHDGVAE